MIHYIADHHVQWSVALGAMMMAWCYSWVAPRFGGISAALLCYLSFSAIWVWVWPDNRYVAVNPYDQMALRYFAADSLARLMAVIVPMMLFAEKIWVIELFGELLCGTFLVINSLWIIASFLHSGCVLGNSCGGLGNPSIMVGAAVSMLPIVVKSWRRQWLILLLVAISVLVSKSSVALGLFGIYLAFSFVHARGLVLAAGLSAMPLVAGYFMLGERDLFSAGNRFEAWQYMMPKWAAWWNIPGGTGWGTYHVFSVNLQAVKHFAQGYHWNTLHNDWLQMLFECGVVGALLFVATYVSALRKALSDKESGYALSILLFGIYMGVNPALHDAIPALFAAWLFICALKRKTNNHIMKEYSHA